MALSAHTGGTAPTTPGAKREKRQSQDGTLVEEKYLGSKCLGESRGVSSCEAESS